MITCISGFCYKSLQCSYKVVETRVLESVKGCDVVREGIVGDSGCCVVESMGDYAV